MKFTEEEKQLITLYCTGSREDLIRALTQMRGDLSQEERELTVLCNLVLTKLKQISDEEFSALDLGPEYVLGQLD